MPSDLALTASALLPDDAASAKLVGRVSSVQQEGPCPVVLCDGHVISECPVDLEMFAPVRDRRGAGQGVTHECGDHVEITSPQHGQLLDWMDRTDPCPVWTFGIRVLMQNLTARGLGERL